MTPGYEHPMARKHVAMEELDSPTAPTSMAGGDLIETPYGFTGGYLTETWRAADALIVLEPPREGDTRTPGQYRWGKRYWASPAPRPGALTRMMIPGRSGRYVVLFEATEDDLGHPGDVVASMTLWPPLWQHAEPEPRVWRGVFSPTYPREVLFSQEIEMRTAELPRWRPHITIDLGRLETPDE